MNGKRGGAMVSRCKLRGISLVELMVGVAIGLLATLVIMQTLFSYEGQKRTTTSGADARVNGALALYVIERDAMSSGYGLISVSGSLGCPIKRNFNGEDLPDLTLQPVTIVDGADSRPDSIQFLSSMRAGWTLPTRISDDHPTTAANFFVDSDLGVREGDMMIAVPSSMGPGTWCTLLQVTKDANEKDGPGKGTNQVLHNSGKSNWNVAGNNNFPKDGYQKGDYLVNLGQMRDNTYSISEGLHLQLTTFDTSVGSAVTTSLYPHIVDLQAVFGKDTNWPIDGVIDRWEVAQPVGNDQWRQTLAIRVALLARSQQWEKDEVTFEKPTWSGDSNKSDIPFSMENVPDWKHYRYRVFETVMPLRNVIWKE